MQQTIQKVGLTKELLQFIRTMQAYKDYVVQKNTLTSGKGSWYWETQHEFLTYSDDFLKKYGLRKNDQSFEKIMQFRLKRELFYYSDKQLAKINFE